MKFKYSKDQEDWIEYSNPSPATRKAVIRLQRVIKVLDAITLATGHSEIIVTSYLRPDNQNSYHSLGQAADIRINDHSICWRLAMCKIGEALKALNAQIQMVPHYELWNKENEHFHVEVDDQSLGNKN